MSKNYDMDLNGSQEITLKEGDTLALKGIYYGHAVESLSNFTIQRDSKNPDVFLLTRNSDNKDIVRVGNDTIRITTTNPAAVSIITLDGQFTLEDIVRYGTAMPEVKMQEAMGQFMREGYKYIDSGINSSAREQAVVVEPNYVSTGLFSSELEPKVVIGMYGKEDRVSLLTETSSKADLPVQLLDSSEIKLEKLGEDHYRVTNMRQGWIFDSTDSQVDLKNFQFSDRLLLADGAYTIQEILENGPNAPIVRDARLAANTALEFMDDKSTPSKSR